MRTSNNFKFNRLLLWVEIFSIVLLTSCQEVIDINLDSVEPQLVVDAQIRNDSVCTVFLTTTSDFFDVDTLIYVNDAEVLLTTLSGDSEQLTCGGNGQYRGEMIKGKSGEEYHLTIKYQDKIYAGISKFIDTTQIYSVKIKDSDAVLGGHGPYYLLELNFKASNREYPYYFIKYYAIGDLKGFNAIDGSRFEHNDTITFTSAQRRFQKGERVRVEIYPVDEGLYQYYRQLSDVAQSNLRNSSAPYNPVSNISNHAVGAFAAWQPSVYELIIE